MARISKVINLSESDRLELLRITKSGTHKSRKVTRALATKRHRPKFKTQTIRYVLIHT